MSFVTDNRQSAHSKRLRLRAGLAGDKPLIVVGAHDAMSARLIGAAGFDAVWVSGFGVSAMAHAMPDMNLITMTETLAAADRIDAATDLPVIADCDNGYGSLGTVVRTIKAHERAGMAGVCIEDNTFPKRNSLLAAECGRDLLPIAEQARRLQAAKAALSDRQFVLIARIESLIAGLGVADACARAEAYVDAGADAILIHSRDATLCEIEGFLGAWTPQVRPPLAVVPTLFPDFSAHELHAKGFQMIILANQLMRAAVRAMEDTLAHMAESGRAATVDPHIASIAHVFELVGTRQALDLDTGP